MSAKTGIQWCDSTWNPVVGCTKVSQGCKLCYAKTLHDRRHKAHLAGKAVAPQYSKAFEVVQLKPERLGAPLSWREPRRVFVNSVSDLFHEDVPDWFIDQVFVVMALAQRHTFQILTKRADRMARYLRARDRVEEIYAQWSTVSGSAPELPAWPLPNVWLGVSVENQQAADKRIPLLLHTPAAVRFLSCEPLLGRVNVLESIPLASAGGLDWVIIGGESGKGARRFELNWAEFLIDQCRGAGVAVFMKQIGALTTMGGPDFTYATGGDAGDMDRWPNQFRVREFPASEVHA